VTIRFAAAAGDRLIAGANANRGTILVRGESAPEP